MQTPVLRREFFLRFFPENCVKTFIASFAAGLLARAGDRRTAVYLCGKSAEQMAGERAGD